MKPSGAVITNGYCGSQRLVSSRSSVVRIFFLGGGGGPLEMLEAQT